MGCLGGSVFQLGIYTFLLAFHLSPQKTLTSCIAVVRTSWRREAEPRLSLSTKKQTRLQRQTSKTHHLLVSISGRFALVKMRDDELINKL